ncbi:hypothetical protein [Parasitella parasitica]|uniref:Uncharacterized protein n=1 Tax=Parasitella parasitica TaxID=35722 RepID=A0A0B7MTF3_9FUNG|nr:hypothetical protein [Parasitella parasitica]
MTETFFGYIETTQDALLIFEGCRRGLVPRVSRRLQEKERRMIRSGSVFVFDESESGIKRWTDGLVWSPSRILGNFLIYRELDKRVPGDKKLSISSASSNDARQRSYSADQSVMGVSSGMLTDRNRERRLVGSLSDSYRFRKDGLIKKTMSIIIHGVAQHLISYYLPSDIIANKLRTPSSVPELASLEISPDLLVKQNFRIPPMVEPPFDQTEGSLANNMNNIGNVMSTVDTMSSPRANDRRVHPFRSMSMGSLRTVNNYQTNSSLSVAGRPDMTYASQQILYSDSSVSQRVNMDNSNKLTPTPVNSNNLSAYYGNQQSTISSLYNCNNSNINGFPLLPSPSSMTSSPNTPLLSPARQSFSSQQQQQSRQYSISSSSPGSISRYNAGRNSFDMMSSQLTANTDMGNSRLSSSVHPHMIPENNVYDQRFKDSNSMTIRDATTQGFSSSPNIGQLLNPIHPLNANGGIKSETMDSNTQFFQSMSISNTGTADYSAYSSNTTPTPANSTNSNKSPTFDGSRLASLSDGDMQEQQPSSNFHGGSYYYRRPHQQQPLTNTHAPLLNEDIAPMFRNGTTLPPFPSMYNDKQNGPELGMELVMLK